MHQQYETKEHICSICSCEYDILLEGGLRGYIGILPICLCPMCFSGLDMLFTTIHGCSDIEEEEDLDG